VHSCNCSAAAFTYNKPVCRGRHWRNRRNNPKEVVYTQKKKKKKKRIPWRMSPCIEFRFFKFKSPCHSGYIQPSRTSNLGPRSRVL
jgi:hypothetical protein